MPTEYKKRNHWYEPEDVYVTGTGQVLNSLHEKSAVCNGGCVIHSPSLHHMRHWPTNWRADVGIMERVCEHGIGHPDPDGARTWPADSALFVHGCDGCCHPTDSTPKRLTVTDAGPDVVEVPPTPESYDVL